MDGGTVFRVEVRHNLVQAIIHVSPEDVGQAQIFDDRLAVSTALTRNNQSNGCFDGDYYLADAETARHFAALCLGFMQNLSESSMKSISDFDLENAGDWENPHIPQPKT